MNEYGCYVVLIGVGFLQKTFCCGTSCKRDKLGILCSNDDVFHQNVVGDLPSVTILLFFSLPRKSNHFLASDVWLVSTYVQQYQKRGLSNIFLPGGKQQCEVV